MLIQSQGSNVFGEDGLTAEGYLNGEATLNVVSWIKDMVDNGYASATPAQNSFELGQAAMAVNGSWAPAGLAEFDINWGLMPMAKYGEDSTPASACGSWTFGMSKDCPDEKKEAAAELIKFMTSLSNQFATAVQNVLTGMEPQEALDEAVTQYNFLTDTE